MTMTMTITMTMTMKPYVKVVIKLEHKIIVGKFAQDEAKAAQRLPIRAVENFCLNQLKFSFQNDKYLELVIFSWVMCGNSL